MKSTRGVSPHRERHHRKDGICRTLLQRSKQEWVEDIDDSNRYATFRQEHARLREEHDVLEIASRGKTGFRIYVIASRGRGGRSGPHPRVMEGLL